MQTNERLYGEGAIPLPVPDYVIKDRVRLLKGRLDFELDKPSGDWDTALTNDIVRAIAFWENINDGGK